MFLTDNRVLVENYRPLRTIMCAQRSAAKVELTEENLIKANIDSFGDDIGKTTNWITSMFDVRAQYDLDSEEYQMLEYRIICGQLYQQNSINRSPRAVMCGEKRGELIHIRCAEKSVLTENI